MSPADSAYVLALTSAVLFSGASVIFARYAAARSPLWMNVMKDTTAGVAFVLAAALALLFTSETLGALSLRPVLYLVASGALGLAVGDNLLFRAYQRMGSARTLLVFSFSPVFLTLEGSLLFGQPLSFIQGVAIFLMMACVWVISFEKFRADGHWEWKGIAFAFGGVLLDNLGIVLSRSAFDHAPGLSPFVANALRSIGAVPTLLLAAYCTRTVVYRSFARLPRADQAWVLGSSLVGTFVSLTLWLTALKIGHIGGLAGVASFNPVAASLWEWALLRKRPTPYLLLALALFLGGFFLLLRSG